jgi:glycosyltransferase involved in cell wall biosynthesis
VRIGYVVSHPIQYQAPLFRALSAQPGVDFEVLFGDDHGMESSHDSGFGREVRFDVPLTGGFRHRFLRNVALRPGPRFTGIINPEIVSLLRRGRHDALIFHGYARATNLIAMLTPRGAVPKVLLRGDSNSRARVGRTKGKVKQVLLRALFKRVDRFLAVGTRNAEYYRAYGVEDSRISFAPYAVDNEFFRERSAAARNAPREARRRLGMPEQHVLFVFCGKLVPAKRPADAIRALALARREVECGLVIVGDGPLRSDLEAEALRLGVASDVAFLGFRNQTELPEIYGACDALVLPSGHEPWGLVVNEAMACGLGTIVSDEVGAAPDLVDDRNGAIFSTGDVAALGKAYRRLAADPGGLMGMKAESFERIRRWSIEESAAGIIAGVRASLAS